MKVVVVVRPNGLGPHEAAKAWYMRKVQKMRFRSILKRVKTVSGKRPRSIHALENAVARTEAAGTHGIAEAGYANCGRRYCENGHEFSLTETQDKTSSPS